MSAALYYDCYENGKWIGCGTSFYWAAQLGISQGHVNKTALRGQKFRGRYKFVKLERKDNNPDKANQAWLETWCREWDETVRRLRGKRNVS